MRNSIATHGARWWSTNHNGELTLWDAAEDAKRDAERALADVEAKAEDGIPADWPELVEAVAWGKLQTHERGMEGERARHDESAECAEGPGDLLDFDFEEGSCPVCRVDPDYTFIIGDLTLIPEISADEVGK